MRILAIGDFHGKFPKKLFKKIKKEKIDFVLSTGDFANADKIRNLVFKCWTSKRWYEVISLKKAKQLEKESFNSGLKILKKLNSTNKKIYTIFGNTDFYKEMLSKRKKSFSPGFYEKEINKLKNIILIERKKEKINNLEIMGHGKYVDPTEYITNPIYQDIKKQLKTIKRYKKSEKSLKDLFLNNQPAKNFIFLIHYTPYKIFDKVKFKKSPMYGKNVGWLPYNNIIKKYKPSLVVCGHMHENQGKQKLHGAWIVNTGAASEGKAAIIEINDDSKKVKNIKFIK